MLKFLTILVKALVFNMSDKFEEVSSIAGDVFNLIGRNILPDFLTEILNLSEETFSASKQAATNKMILLYVWNLRQIYRSTI